MPMPEPGWCALDVNAIGPILRDDDPEKGYTVTMCTPILPNQAHPTDEPAIRTTPRFPFSNCYHWAFANLNIRIFAPEDEWFSDSTRCSFRSMFIMQGRWQREWYAVNAARDQQPGMDALCLLV